MRLAKEAVELKPEEGTFWNTLGAAQYRAGDWKAAIAALESRWSCATAATARLVLPGDGPLAARREGQGPRVVRPGREWMDKNQPNNEELRRFRAEAAELLELKEKK